MAIYRRRYGLMIRDGGYENQPLRLMHTLDMIDRLSSIYVTEWKDLSEPDMVLYGEMIKEDANT